MLNVVNEKSNTKQKKMHTRYSQKSSDKEKRHKSYVKTKRTMNKHKSRASLKLELIYEFLFAILRLLAEIKITE